MNNIPIINRLEQDLLENSSSRLFQTFLLLAQGKNKDFVSDKGRHVLAYTESEDSAFEIARSFMKKKGLETFTDIYGNLFGVYYPEGCNKNLPAVISGSHLDSVGTIDRSVGGGIYDGVLGVAAALEAVSNIKEKALVSGQKLLKPLAVVCWRGEESSLWGRSCLGSSLASGSLKEKDLQKYHTIDSSGLSMHLKDKLNRLRKIGKAQGNLPICLQSLHESEVIELHIEQGPNVQRGEIGIVTTAIAGAIRDVLEFSKSQEESAFHELVVRVREKALKLDRYAERSNAKKDYLVFRATVNRGTEAFNVGSAKETFSFADIFRKRPDQIKTIKTLVITYLQQHFPKVKVTWSNEHCIISCSTQFHTGTCPMKTREEQDLDALYIASALYMYLKNNHGICPILLGDTNKARMDIRGTHLEYMQKGRDEILSIVDTIRSKLNSLIDLDETRGVSKPAAIHNNISDKMKELAQNMGLKFQTLVSGAGHDVMKFNKNGLIFIHSEKGLSHDSAEYSYPNDIERGTRFLQEVLENLARS